jgi:hypothetical protein
LEGGVDDGGVKGSRLESFEEVLLAFVTGEGRDDEVEVGAVEGELVVVLFSDFKVAANIFRNLRGGGGGEAEDARDAMGFVDGEEGEFHLFEAGPEFLVGEAFGGDVEEFEVVVFEALVEVDDFVFGEGGVESRGGDLFADQGVNLVLHQGDEGGDDEGEAIEKEGGELVAE